MTMIKPWNSGGSFKSHLREIYASLKRIVEIPVGYQDENSFHYGAEPCPRDIQLPRA